MTHFVCFHPYAARRRYDDLEVCRECAGVRRDTGFWPSVRRLIHGDGRLTELDGSILYRDWYWSRLR